MGERFTGGSPVQIYEVNADGSGQIQITTGAAVNALPEWCCTQAP